MNPYPFSSLNHLTVPVGMVAMLLPAACPLGTTELRHWHSHFTVEEKLPRAAVSGLRSSPCPAPPRGTSPPPAGGPPCRTAEPRSPRRARRRRGPPPRGRREPSASSRR